MKQSSFQSKHFTKDYLVKKDQVEPCVLWWSFQGWSSLPTPLVCDVSFEGGEFKVSHYTELSLQLPGSFHFFFTIANTKAGAGYFKVD